MDYSVYTIEQLTDWYLENRAFIAQQEEALEATLAPVNKTQDEIQTELQRRLNEAGVTSANTPNAQVVQSTTVRYRAEDKAAFGEFIVKTGKWEASTVIPSAEFMREYQAENNGNLPAGVTSYSTHKLAIKRR